MSNNLSKHLFHVAKRNLVDPTIVKYFLHKYSEKARHMGALPYDIISGIPKKDRGNITKDIDKLFSDFAASVSYIWADSDALVLNASLFFERCNKLKTQLQDLLNSQNISVEYIDSGVYKHCFVLNFGDTSKSYTLQTFQPTISFDNDYKHGALFEPQNYFTTYKNSSKGRVARPFMSRPTNKEILSDGYILTKFIDMRHCIKKERGKFISRRDKMTSEDITGDKNTISGIIVDTGGFEYNPEHIADRKTCALWQDFAQILDTMDFHSTNAYDISKYLLNKYNKIGEQFFDTNIWPKMISKFHDEDKLKCAKKMLRALRRLKIKREKLESENKYGPIQELLRQDFIELFDFTVANPEFPKPPVSMFYPEIVCKILGVDNVPPLENIAKQMGLAKCNVSIISLDCSKRIHWNKYYAIDEVKTVAEKYPWLDWSTVIDDFKKPNFVKKILQKIQTR